MSPRRRAASVRAYLEQRIATALEWYEGCDACDETLKNVRRDLDSLVAETGRKFGIDMPVMLRARFDGSVIVVTSVDRKVS